MIVMIVIIVAIVIIVIVALANKGIIGTVIVRSIFLSYSDCYSDNEEMQYMICISLFLHASFMENFVHLPKYQRMT